MTLTSHVQHADDTRGDEQVTQPNVTSAEAGQAPPIPAKDRPRSGGDLLGKWGPSIGILVLVLIAWEVLPPLLGVESFIFPTLSEVVGKFLDPLSLELYLTNAVVTIQEAVGGLAIGAVLGIVVGFLLGQYPAFRRVMYPYVIALQSLPKVAVAPLFVIWFGFGMTPKLLVVVMMTFFPVLVNTISGVMGVEKDKLDLFRSLSASRVQTWRKLVFPSALPSIMSGLSSPSSSPRRRASAWSSSSSRTPMTRPVYSRCSSSSRSSASCSTSSFPSLVGGP